MALVILIFALSTVVAVIGVATMPVCPFCHARGSFKHRHRRVNGKPDLRYRDNPVVCTRCGKKQGLVPPSAEQVEEIDRWKKLGFEAGRAGGAKDLPAEIRPMIGTSTTFSAAWYGGWFAGNRHYMWEKGFADGLAGRPNLYLDFDASRHQAWIEGDAKRKGLHYFPSWDAKTKVKDATAE